MKVVLVCVALYLNLLESGLRRFTEYDRAAAQSVLSHVLQLVLAGRKQYSIAKGYLYEI